VLQSKRERLFQPLGKARIHRFKRFPAPGAVEPRIILKVGVAIVVEAAESHERAAWVGLLAPVKAPESPIAVESGCEQPKIFNEINARSERDTGLMARTGRR